MSTHEIKNLAASVHRRLLNKAKEEGRPFNELLQYYAMERFLYRLSKSPHSKKFVLKGALMLVAWKAPLTRPTSDIDLLGAIDNKVRAVVSVLRDVCTVPVEPDGMEFDPESVVGKVITEIAEYPGVRANIIGALGGAVARVQVDVGFGDLTVPGSRMIDYPVLLDMPVPRLRGYSRESAIAEKLESIARFGMRNSRLKDYYDIWLLARRFDFDGAALGTAIEATFTNRGRPVKAEMLTQMEEYARDKTKAVQWRAFCRKNKLDSVPLDFPRVVASIVEFIGPVVSAIASKQPAAGTWQAPGPWQ